ncbi:hypothetical protein, conserved [Plasmodium ovale curtisi]|uniref:Uncharacterized protein n=1 Tax=Plasmodium ovale curtisi TaxID=864141 RepID=A0A1A8WFJ4_PLAOA|nr:hypothetical protein, conserved [Plasmodium ovale curtisi]
MERNEKKKKKKTLPSEKDDNLSTHQKFDRLIDEFYPKLKDERADARIDLRVEANVKEGDHVFKSVERSRADYARLDENDEPPTLSDLVENGSILQRIPFSSFTPVLFPFLMDISFALNRSQTGCGKDNQPYAKSRADELKEGYMQWMKTERLMRPNERRQEYEDMQKQYLETLKLSRDIKKDVKLARVINSHYPRGIVGVDSIYNEKTVLYKDKHEEFKNKQEVKEKRMKERGKGESSISLLFSSVNDITTKTGTSLPLIPAASDLLLTRPRNYVPETASQKLDDFALRIACVDTRGHM